MGAEFTADMSSTNTIVVAVQYVFSFPPFPSPQLTLSLQQHLRPQNHESHQLVDPHREPHVARGLLHPMARTLRRPRQIHHLPAGVDVAGLLGERGLGRAVLMDLEAGDAEVGRQAKAGQETKLEKETPNVSASVSPKERTGQRLEPVGTGNSVLEVREVEEAVGLKTRLRVATVTGWRLTRSPNRNRNRRH